MTKTIIAFDNTIASDGITAKELDVRLVRGHSGRPTARLAPADALNTVADVKPRTYLWHLWPGRNWPSTSSEEAVFVAELRDRADFEPAAKRGERYDRGDVTSVCNALRCGLTADELFSRAPGMKARRLLAAYEALESSRQVAVDAWEEIIAERSLEALVDWAAAASILMAVPVRRMLPSAGNLTEDLLASRIDMVHRQVITTIERAEDIENRMQRCEYPSAVGIELGRLLYDPYNPGLWGDPMYLPTRVGVLTPTRVSDLLGERRS